MVYRECSCGYFRCALFFLFFFFVPDLRRREKKLLERSGLIQSLVTGTMFISPTVSIAVMILVHIHLEFKLTASLVSLFSVSLVSTILGTVLRSFQRPGHFTSDCYPPWLWWSRLCRCSSVLSQPIWQSDVPWKEAVARRHSRILGRGRGGGRGAGSLACVITDLAIPRELFRLRVSNGGVSLTPK